MDVAKAQGRKQGGSGDGSKTRKQNGKDDTQRDQKISGGGGQSRASKKRAKRKSKEVERQQEQQKQPDSEEVDKHRAQDSTSKKRKKRAVREDEAGDAGVGKKDFVDDGDDDDDVVDGESVVAGTTDMDATMNNVGDGDHSEDEDEKDVHDLDGSTSGKNTAESATSASSHKSNSDDDDNLLAVEDCLCHLSAAQILNPPPPTSNDEEGTGGEERTADETNILSSITTAARAKALLRSFLGPNVTTRQFYDTYWEKQPLVVHSDGSTTTTKSTHARATETTKDHKDSHRFCGILSKADIESMLQKKSLRYGLDLNVTNYCLQQGSRGLVKRRMTLDPPPHKRVNNNNNNNNKRNKRPEEDDWEHVVADPADVWSNFDHGCTLRLLCPHLYADTVHSLLSLLELEWGCMVGANAYLTPGAANNDDEHDDVETEDEESLRGQRQQQGFAPHYDDIEAFVLQLEGRKRWRVYAPLSRSEVLPRQSSADFREETDLKDVSPVLDVVLEPGDLLYMPRGWIHQAHTLVDHHHQQQRKQQHSLHLTVSAMQQWAWVDLLELVIPSALEAAMASSRILREGLPRNFLSYMGTMHDPHDDPESLPEGLRQAAAAAKKRDQEENSGNENHGDDNNERIRRERLKQLRHQFKEEGRRRIMRVCKEAVAMLEMGCDEMGKRFLSDRQPPALTAQEAAMSRNGGGLVKAGTTSATKIWPTTLCRLVRPGIARLAIESEEEEENADPKKTLSAPRKVVVYHCNDNSRVYRGTALSPLEFELDDAPAIEALLTTVEPHWIMVNDLYHDDVQDKVAVAQALYDEGILAICPTATVK